MNAAPHFRTLRERLAMASRCGARRKHDGCPCQQPAMANGRCRFHGGKSTGPKTREGVERAQQSALRHGFYTAEAQAERRIARAALVSCERLWRAFRDVVSQAGATATTPSPPCASACSPRSPLGRGRRRRAGERLGGASL